MVINKGLGRKDGLGTATVGGREAERRKRCRTKKEMKFLFESLKKKTENKKKIRKKRQAPIRQS